MVALILLIILMMTMGTCKSITSDNEYVCQEKKYCISLQCTIVIIFFLSNSGMFTYIMFLYAQLSTSSYFGTYEYGYFFFINNNTPVKHYNLQ